MASTLSDHYKKVDEKMEQYRTEIVEQTPNFDNASHEAVKQLQEVLSQIKALIRKLGDDIDKLSCVMYDQELIDILDGHPQVDRGLYQAVFLKLIYDTVNESRNYDDQPWNYRNNLLMYGWRCRLLSFLVDEMGAKFVEWYARRQDHQATALLRKLGYTGD